MKVVDEMRKIGFQLVVADIFRHPKLQHVASQVASTSNMPNLIPKMEQRSGPVEQSFAQERLWFLEQLHPGLDWYLCPLPSYCRRCLDAAASWHPEKSVRAKGGSHIIEAPTFCSPVSGSASSKCSRCVKNGKPCEVLARGDRPILVNLFTFLAAGQFPKTKAEYLESPSVQAVRTPARRLLHRLKFGDKNARARSSAADAAAVAAREASEAAARAQLMELTALQVQIDIANHLRCLTQHMLCGVRGSDVPPCYTMPERVGPETVPAELNFTASDDEEEDDE